MSAADQSRPPASLRGGPPKGQGQNGKAMTGRGEPPKEITAQVVAGQCGLRIGLA